MEYVACPWANGRPSQVQGRSAIPPGSRLQAAPARDPLWLHTSALSTPDDDAQAPVTFTLSHASQLRFLRTYVAYQWVVTAQKTITRLVELMLEDLSALDTSPKVLFLCMHGLCILAILCKCDRSTKYFNEITPPSNRARKRMLLSLKAATHPSNVLVGQCLGPRV